jgi:hypothetical protein
VWLIVSVSELAMIDVRLNTSLTIQMRKPSDVAVAIDHGNPEC